MAIAYYIYINIPVSKRVTSLYARYSFISRSYCTQYDRLLAW